MNPARTTLSPGEAVITDHESVPVSRNFQKEKGRMKRKQSLPVSLVSRPGCGGPCACCPAVGNTLAKRSVNPAGIENAPLVPPLPAPGKLNPPAGPPRAWSWLFRLRSVTSCRCDAFVR